MFPASDPLTVIIVADDPLVRLGLTNLIEAEGLSVVAAVSGSELATEQGDAEALLWDADPVLDAEATAQQDVPVLALISEDDDPSPLLAAGGCGSPLPHGDRRAPCGRVARCCRRADGARARLVTAAATCYARTRHAL